MDAELAAESKKAKISGNKADIKVIDDIVSADYSSLEMRFLAHYCTGRPEQFSALMGSVTGRWSSNMSKQEQEDIVVGVTFDEGLSGGKVYYYLCNIPGQTEIIEAWGRKGKKAKAIVDSPINGLTVVTIREFRLLHTMAACRATKYIVDLIDPRHYDAVLEKQSNAEFEAELMKWQAEDAAICSERLRIVACEDQLRRQLTEALRYANDMQIRRCVKDLAKVHEDLEANDRKRSDHSKRKPKKGEKAPGLGDILGEALKRRRQSYCGVVFDFHS